MSTLYLVSTPIGNLEDITLRALRVLKEAALVAAEDTRHSGRLLQHFGIDKPLVSLHEHNETGRIPDLLAALDRGEAIALVSDAGTPTLSDPGYRLVRAAIEAGHTITPIPGPSALLAALAPSGLPSDRFLFLGFPPRKAAARAELLRNVAAEPGVLVFYESPQRLPGLLTDIAGILGLARQVVIAREITKRFETFWRGTAADAVAAFTDPPLGEIVVIVSGAPAEANPAASADVEAALDALLSGGMAPPDAAHLLAALTGLPRRDVYRLAISREE